MWLHWRACPGCHWAHQEARSVRQWLDTCHLREECTGTGRQGGAEQIGLGRTWCQRVADWAWGGLGGSGGSQILIPFSVLNYIHRLMWNCANNSAGTNLSWSTRVSGVTLRRPPKAKTPEGFSRHHIGTAASLHRELRWIGPLLELEPLLVFVVLHHE